MTLLWGKFPVLGARTVGAAGMLKAGKVAGEVRKDSFTPTVVSFNSSRNALGIYGSALSSSGDSKLRCFFKINSGHPGKTPGLFGEFLLTLKENSVRQTRLLWRR